MKVSLVLCFYWSNLDTTCSFSQKTPRKSLRREARVGMAHRTRSRSVAIMFSCKAEAARSQRGTKWETAGRGQEEGEQLTMREGGGRGRVTYIA